MTRCGLDLSGEKTKFKPWILVLIMKLTVISFNDGFSELDFLTGVSWESFCLGGPRATDSAVGASTIIARDKAGASSQMLFPSSQLYTSPVYTQWLSPQTSPDLCITNSR